MLPVVKSGLRKLSRPEERASYRAHVLSKFQSIFSNFEGLDAQQSGVVGESDINEQEEGEDKLTIKLDDDDRIMPSDGKEDDRFKEEEPDPEQKLEDEFKDFVKPGTNPTGARVAFETINDSNIQSVLADKRKTLFDDDDKNQFKNYALYNVDLWLLTYEKELADTKGQEPAFTEVMTDKPVGAEVKSQAAEFGGEAEMPEEEAMPALGGA